MKKVDFQKRDILCSYCEGNILKKDLTSHLTLPMHLNCQNEMYKIYSELEEVRNK